MYLPIKDYGMIGDLRTAALVGTNASIDYMCFPRFDSPTIFAALLDDTKGGYFKLAPEFEDADQQQIYLPDTAVLLSRFMAAEGMAEVSDFMPIAQGEAQCMIRRAKAIHGNVRFRVVCKPRFDYAKSTPQLTRTEEGVVFTSQGPQKLVLRLRAAVDFTLEDGAAVAEFTLKPGEKMAFILEELKEGKSLLPSGARFISEAFKETLNFWREWVGRSSYSGPWREQVNRSALTLKLLTYAPEGSIVAAATFGLPEKMGGSLNWDYRYTWIRDASFTLLALLRLGYTEEATAFMKWFQARASELSGGETLQVMYGLSGERDLTEKELPYLKGYQDSQPVRIGNGAYDQLQLGMYGIFMQALYIYNRDCEPISYELWSDVERLINWVCNNWERPNNGIWEVRGEKRQTLYPQLMCWLALTRGYQLALERSFPAPLNDWRQTRDKIFRHIFDTFWDPELGAFVQSKGSKTLDASCLFMSMIEFLGPSDPRWLSTLAAVDKELAYDALVFRYKLTEDGGFKDEGTFNMCSFWLVECYARTGDLQTARLHFEKLLSHVNSLGLYSEELAARGGYLGNYPQAFTHMALISAACELAERLAVEG